jgi:hypothetical protein
MDRTGSARGIEIHATARSGGRASAAMESFAMSSVTNIVAGRLGLAAMADLPGRPVASPADLRAPSSYGMTRLGIVPSEEDLAPLPVPLARPAVPRSPAGPAEVPAAMRTRTPRAEVTSAPGAPATAGPAACQPTAAYELPPSCQEPAGGTALAVRWSGSADGGALAGPCVSQSGIGAPSGLAAALHIGPAETGASPGGTDQFGSIQPPPAAAAAEPTVDHEPAPPDPQAQDDAAAKRRTFRLPGRLASCLKAYAATTGQYQYVVATEALRHFLDQAVPALDFARRARLAELQAHLAPAEAGPPPAPSGETPAAPQTAEIPNS